MVEIEFDFNQQITVIQAKLDEPFKNVINKYLQKSLLDSNNVFFFANGRQINPEEKVEKQISLNNGLIGITNLEGQGVEITLRDDPTATKETIGIFDDISNHIIHDGDLRAVVNELKNAGAEAISINGQRLVNTTAITCIRKCN